MASVTCPSCNAEVAADATLCPRCFAFVVPASTPAAASPALPLSPPPPAVPVSPAPPAATCPRAWCATALPAGATTCPGCGVRVTPEQVAQPPRPGGGASSAVCAVLPGGTSLTVPAGTSLVLGRESDDPRVCSALDPFDGVSRRHAALLAQPSGLVVHDLGSTNGTFVDGRQVTGSVSVGPGPHELRLGRRAVIALDVSEVP
ncbi:MAG: FHA domain-containing protein [Actinomycetes bacterium]